MPKKIAHGYLMEKKLNHLQNIEIFFLLKLAFESMMGFYLKKCLRLKKHVFIKTIKICIKKNKL
jgi:hypothetical protein